MLKLIKNYKMHTLKKDEHEYFSKTMSGNFLCRIQDVNLISIWYKNELIWMDYAINEYEKKIGIKACCKINCSSCCKQAIYINPTEFELLKFSVKKLPKDIRNEAIEKAKSHCSIAKNNGIDLKFTNKQLTFEEQTQIGIKYMSLDLSCPLLFDNKCAIYEMRPLICATYRNYGKANDCLNDCTPKYGHSYLSLDSQITNKLYNYHRPKNTTFRILIKALTDI